MRTLALAQVPPITRGASWTDWAPLLGLTTLAIALKESLPPWGVMWTLAIAIFAGFKWWTWCRATSNGMPVPAFQSFAYFFLWPGMDARRFLAPAQPCRKIGLAAWTWALVKTSGGAVLVWSVARLAGHGLLAGWIGMVGTIFLLHFGLFALLALFWQQRGILVQPLMDCPIAADSLSDFWGRRWNSGFRDLVFGLFFIRLAKRWGTAAATMLIFAFSGLIHDLVITFPARGGYGLPTLYFVVQGVAILIERSEIGTGWALAQGWRGHVFTLMVVAAPVLGLFPPPFVLHVMVPFFQVIGALP